MIRENAVPLALSVKEAIARTGLSRSTLHTAVRDGRLKHCRVGRRVLFLPEHLQEFLKAHETSGAKTAGAC